MMLFMLILSEKPLPVRTFLLQPVADIGNKYLNNGSNSIIGIISIISIIITDLRQNTAVNLFQSG